MANASYQMHQIVKTLASVSTIFTPLTFIAGICGMNCKNMPELQVQYGYQLSWAQGINGHPVVATQLDYSSNAI